MFLKPIKAKKEYERLIASKIVVWLYVNIFQQCFQILKPNTIVLNDSNIIREAITSGKIQYQDGVFTGKFTNALALELEKLGAKYSKYRKGYVIAKDLLPVEITWAIDTAKAVAYAKATAINQYLLNQLSNIDKLTQKLVFDDAVNAIMMNLQDRVYKNAKQHKIELITPKLDDFMKDEIARKYTNNLNFWIKNRAITNIPEMREKIAQMASEGKSLKTISEYIRNRFGVEQRHAQFLARNESAIATASYLSTKYQAEGFTHFKWHAMNDERTRPYHSFKGGQDKMGEYHKGLDGQVFRYDDPPVIDLRTGKKGLPGETYNCRCVASPYIDKEFLKRRRAMFEDKKAQNSLLENILNCLNLKR